MNPVVAREGMATASAAGTPATQRPTLTTTLYDLVAAVQASVEPDEEDLAVAIVVHILRTCRSTLSADARV